MTDDRDDLLREIGATLSIEPTPEFAAKVRRAIDTAGPSSRPMAYILAGATLVAVVAIAAATFVVRQDPEAPTTGAARAPAVPEPDIDVGRREMTPDVASARRTPKPERSRRRQAPPIVAAEEVGAFWRLVAAVRADEVTIPQARWPISDSTGEIEPLPEIPAIQLPVVTIEPLPATASDDKVGGTDD